MDKVIFIPSIILGLLFIGLHLFRCKKQREEPNIGIIINAILTAGSIVCALFLIVGSVFEPIMKYVSGLNLYIFIAGVALFYVSAQSIYRDILKKEKKKN
jgi:O-antigen/teichoic acid export membrane protein